MHTDKKLRKAVVGYRPHDLGAQECRYAVDSTNSRDQWFLNRGVLPALPVTRAWDHLFSKSRARSRIFFSSSLSEPKPCELILSRIRSTSSCKTLRLRILTE